MTFIYAWEHYPIASFHGEPGSPSEWALVCRCHGKVHLELGSEAFCRSIVANCPHCADHIAPCTQQHTLEKMGRPL